MDAALPATGPLLAVDWGARRIGVAISNEAQTIAHPLATLTRRTGRRFPLNQLRSALDNREPVGVVMGLPIEPDGSEGPHCLAAREIGELIGSKTGLPVVYVDERMSTARVLATHRETGVGVDRDHIDAMAAAVFLQQYLDTPR